MASKAQKDAAEERVQGHSSQLAELAASQGMVLTYTSDVVDLVASDLLMKMYGKEGCKDLDARIEKAWKTLNPRGRFQPDSFPVSGTMLMGPPGHGKTSVLRAASKRVAELTALNYVDNPPDDYQITRDDFVFMSMEFAGVNSAIQIRGIPYKNEVDTEEGREQFLSFLKDRGLTYMSKAGGAMLNLDDVMNGSPSMINVALPLFEEGRYAGLRLDNVLVCGTGNLGSLDGTKTSEMSSALRGRARILLVRDNYLDLAHRLRASYSIDDLGDRFFAHFIERKGAHFLDMLPVNGHKGGYPSSRTVEKALQAHRREVNRVGGPEFAMGALENFEASTGSLIGPEMGAELKAYLASAYKGADPIARTLIMDGVESEGLKQYTDNPLTQEATSFFHQFGAALAEWAAVRISTDKDPAGKVFEETCKNFCTGLYKMEGAPFVAALEMFRENILNRVPELGMTHGQGRDQTRAFTDSVIERIRVAFTGHKDFSKHHLNDLANILSGLSELMTSPATMVGTRAKGGSKKSK